jgi:DmsE family decaheme c-type cytochrome
MPDERERDPKQAYIAAAGRAAVPVCVFAMTLLLAQAFAQNPGPQPGQQTPTANSFANVGTQGCLICHSDNGVPPATGILQSPHGVTGNPRAPLAAGAHQCEDCHGPSEAHLRVIDGVRPPPAVSFSAIETAAVKDAACLGCHEREAGIHWAASAHRFEQVACADCHLSHTAQDPVLTAAGEAGVCFACHERERAEFLRRSAHPVTAGLMQCTSCHTPHGSAADGLLTRTTINETCYDCHAEKRGPFLWEHAPVREDCTNCHVPHGSSHADLLIARTPFLCQQCHLAAFHPSTVMSGANAPPQGASHLLLAQNCMNCHSQVHGSNHPSGPGLTR